MAGSTPVTTAGVIAVRNLHVQIDRQVARATAGQLTLGERAELADLLALRGHVLGSIADLERAAANDEALAIRRAVVEKRPDFGAMAALAGIYGETGETGEAQRWFNAAFRSYRG